MTQHDNICIVPVPECAFDLAIVNGTLSYCGKHGSIALSLPPGSWRIVGRALELTEEKWRDVIKGEYLDDDYMPPRWPDFESTMYYSATATESGMSLLRSLGIDPETNPLILIKK